MAGEADGATDGFIRLSLPNESVGPWPIYVKGEGANILLLHDLSGPTQRFFGFANRIAGAGFRVHVPILFSVIGQSSFIANTVAMFRAGELRFMAGHRPSVMLDHLRTLCRTIGRTGNVGVIGLGFAGHFPIVLMAEAVVRAAVTCAPSMPVLDTGLPLSEAEFDASRDSGIDLLGWRWGADNICPRTRFRWLKEQLGDHFLSRTLQRSSVFPSDGHAIFTDDFIDQEGDVTVTALNETMAFLRQRLA